MAFDHTAFGLDSLDGESGFTDYRPPVPGRVAHIDADFLAYMIAVETRDELDGIKPRRSLAQMLEQARDASNHLMRLARAERHVCHVTPPGSTKGGRREQAVQHEYQKARTDKTPVEFLDTLRLYFVQELHGVAHLDQEADDGLAQANYAAFGSAGSCGNATQSIIISRDKDLRMVPGLHMDWTTGDEFCVGHPFGSLYVEEKERKTATGKTVKDRKLKGWGTKWFWAQCLMGDTVDTINGLPGIVSDNGVVRPVGPITAYEILLGCNDDRQCFETVRDLYVEYGKVRQFTHWRTGEPVSATTALLGEMQLLWMRRRKDPNDVVSWLKEQLA